MELRSVILYMKYQENNGTLFSFELVLSHSGAKYIMLPPEHCDIHSTEKAQGVINDYHGFLVHLVESPDKPFCYSDSSDCRCDGDYCETCPGIFITSCSHLKSTGIFSDGSIAEIDFTEAYQFINMTRLKNSPAFK